MGVDPRLVGGVATTAAVAILALAVDDAAIARAATERALAPPRSRRVHAISAHNAGESSGAPGTVEVRPTAASRRAASPPTGALRFCGAANACGASATLVTAAIAGGSAGALAASGAGRGAGTATAKVAGIAAEGRVEAGIRCGAAELVSAAATVGDADSPMRKLKGSRSVGEAPVAPGARESRR